MIRIILLISIYAVFSIECRSAVSHVTQHLSSGDTVTSEKSDEHKFSEDAVVTKGIFKDLSNLYKIYQECSNKDISICLKIKLLHIVDRAYERSERVKSVGFVDGIKFERDRNIGKIPATSTDEVIPTEEEIEASLPRSLDEKEGKLNALIFKKIGSFLQNYTLQIKFPTFDEFQRSFSDEGRDKKKKKSNGAFVMIPLLLGGTFVPIAYGALALLAGKALIVSKLALVLASIIGIKKLLSGSHKESQHEVVVSGGHGGSGWGRDFDLAYNGYAPKDRTKDA